MPVQYDGRSGRARRRAHAVRRVRRLPHGRDRDERAATPRRSCSGSCPTTSRRSHPAAAPVPVLCREDGGVLDDLFTYSLGADRYLTVTNAANHESDLAWFRAHAAGFDVDVADRADRLRDARRAGPACARDRPGDRRRPLPARMTARAASLARRAAARLRHRLHGRGRRRAAVDPADAPALWDELVGRGATPAGLAARDTLRLEVCFHLYGNDLMETRGPIEAGLGWCCKEDTGFIGADAVRAVRAAGPAEKLVAFKLDRPGHRPAGQPGRRRRRGHERDDVARAWTSASAWPTCRPSRPPGARRSRSTSAARRAPPSWQPSRSTKK